MKVCIFAFISDAEQIKISSRFNETIPIFEKKK